MNTNKHKLNIPKRLVSPKANPKIFSAAKSGFTLAEAMIALVILSILTVSMILPFAASAEVQLQGKMETAGAKLASDLMEQILNTDFASIVSTYNGYSESKGNILTATGAKFTDSLYSNMTRQALCQYVYTSGQDNTVSPNFIRITVTVYNNDNKLVEIMRLIAE